MSDRTTELHGGNILYDKWMKTSLLCDHHCPNHTEKQIEKDIIG